MIPGHTEPLEPSHCRLCWIYHNDKRYRDLIDGVPEKVVLPCKHVGRPISIDRKASLGLDLRLGWTECGLNLGYLPGVACPCRGCGPACPGYSAE